MDGFKEELAELKASTSKRFKFLDDKINELTEELRPQLKKLQSQIKSAEYDVYQANEKIVELKEAAVNRQKQIDRIDSQMGGLASMVWVGDFFKESFQPLANRFDSLSKDVKNISAKSMFNDSEIKNLHSCINGLNSKFGQIQKDLDDIDQGIQNLESSISKIQEDQKVERQEAYLQLDSLKDSVKLEMARHNQVVYKLDKRSDETDSRIKRERIELSESIFSKFTELEQECQGEMETNRKNQSDVHDQINTIKYEVDKCVLNGKSSKELEDFMKQVGYNAQQIAKINDRIQE